jgi:uncharacterized membrane protein YtjA (UPF0391 family)
VRQPARGCGVHGSEDGIAFPANVKGCPMLSYALIFLILALVAALLGFGGIASTAAGIAKILFVVFLVLFLVSLIAGRGWV